MKLEEIVPLEKKIVLEVSARATAPRTKTARAGRQAYGKRAKARRVTFKWAGG